MNLIGWIVSWKWWVIGAVVWIGIWIFVSLESGRQRNITEEAKLKWFYANNCKKSGYVAQRYGAIQLYDCNGVPYIWADIPKADK